MKWTLLAVTLGFFLDLLLGDPHWLYHPVRIIGKWITLLENGLRRLFPSTPRGERIAGTVLAVCIVGCSAGVPWLILWVADTIHPAAGVICETWMCYQLLAARSLREESKKVYDALKDGDLEKARYAVSMIVGRDTQKLDEQGVAKAAVETVAENTSDGIIAPLFYMMLGGAVLGFAYKAVNTMDSMVGYRNDRYRYFGTAAARLDDVLNYLPARISAWLMIFASWLLKLDAKSARRIYYRDRYRHDSPNSAHTEAVMAGALGIRLAGDAWYFGVLHKKEYLGDRTRDVEYQDILRSHRLMYATAVLALIVFGLVRLAVVQAAGVWL